MAALNGNKPHVLAVPVPAQGHVKPLMNLCRRIAKHGIKVTFVNAESIHQKIVAAAKMDGEDDDNIVLASVPDGLNPEDDLNDLFTLLEILRRTMPVTLVDLIERINGSNPNEKVSCVVADLSIGWIFEIAEKMGAEPVGFSPPSVASLALMLRIPKLLEEGSLDTNGALIMSSPGSLKKGDIISLSDNMPGWRKDEYCWSFPSQLKTQKILFECIKPSDEYANKAEWLICNTCYELEPGACDFSPNLLPIGPLHLQEIKSPKSCSNWSNFYREDASCLNWLDSKPARSVVYVSFGSLAVFSQQQLDELALGLELSGRAFLWVVRPGLANGSRAVCPNSFLERGNGLGKIVEWAPQDEVLSHPSVACFVSHCGWNSTIEGVSKGVPFLCWPSFGDQFHNESYICDEWGVGLRINPDDSGIRPRDEIKTKIDMLFANNNLKENALKLKEICEKSVSEGGSSNKNLEKFIYHLRK